MRNPRQIPFELDATGAEPETLLPVVLTVDDTDSPRDVIDVLALSAFVAGRQPYASTQDLANVREDATLLPPGVRVLRESTSETERALLAAADGWTLRAVRWPRTRTATVGVTAVSAELAAQVMAQATEGVTEEPAAEAGVVSMGFWYTGPRRPAGAGSGRQRPVPLGPASCL